MDDIVLRKKEVRSFYRSLRNELCDEYRRFCDNELFKRVINSTQYKESDVLLAYYPVKNEPNILPIVEHALSCGKKVAFPISDTENFTLMFAYITSLSELFAGGYSIPEPLADAEKYVNANNALCIVPALAFDRAGRRIGYGKGFYDRFISGFGGITLGLCYSRLLADSLPFEKTDIPVNIIITEKEEIITNVK